MGMQKDYFFLKCAGTTIDVNSLVSDVVASEPARCSFVIHPLHAKQLWKHPLLRLVKFLPRTVQNKIEKWVAHLPAVRYSQLKGVKSFYNGKEAVCDLMLMMATPKQLLGMNENFLNQRLLECADQSMKTGSKIIGLGAYTKVAGDGGVQVTDRASIPVTTGNSLSAASTLWAAEAALKKVHPQLKRNAEGRLPLRVMVIGATGSIGRVTSLLLSEEVTELFLISRSMNKLEELRDEISSVSSNCKVKIATGVGSSIQTVDLLITATSNQGKKLFDVDSLKPGAVVCDCSRPMDFTKNDAISRPDVLFIESGEVSLPGNPQFTKSVLIERTHIYACLAETLILSLENRLESFSYSRKLDVAKVREISDLAHRHGATLAPLRGPLGLITEEQYAKVRSHQKQKVPGAFLMPDALLEMKAEV